MKPSPRSAPARHHGPPGEVRLIGGQWKRSKLPVPSHDGLRPTPDRVRETLYNWLGQDLTGWRCLDAFAGSGALGFEAASRGATEVVLLERDAALAAALRATQARLGATAVRIEATDALAWMARHPGSGFDLVLLDPPFAAGLHAAAVDAAVRLVVPGGWVYVESDSLLDPQILAPQALLPHRHLRAGLVHAHLWRAASP